MLLSLTRIRDSWVRWLTRCGVPPDHIARILDLDQADVDQSLSRPRQLPSRPWVKGNRSATCLRGLHGTRALRMAALGYDVEQIARALNLNPTSVCRLIAPRPPRPERRPPPTPEQCVSRQFAGKPLSRPRSRREQAALCEWSRFEEPDDDLVEVLPAIAADELPAGSLPATHDASARKTGVRGMPTTRPARMPRLRSCPTKTSAGCARFGLRASPSKNWPTSSSSAWRPSSGLCVATPTAT